ncbi:hypothetical protein PsYK624_123880 [Phanerochaete sordida]|uniref:Uncharacterized protein n=1 Tax=Phanerochaete sordida TaxID=48140 RepID=A0A9P3GMH6_9APHY|nr:hypothetical protein PsYK624_123880 [Phanerochaete sordida]
MRCGVSKAYAGNRSGRLTSSCEHNANVSASATRASRLQTQCHSSTRDKKNVGPSCVLQLTGPLGSAACEKPNVLRCAVCCRASVLRIHAKPTPPQCNWSPEDIRAQVLSSFTRPCNTAAVLYPTNSRSTVEGIPVTRADFFRPLGLGHPDFRSSRPRAAKNASLSSMRATIWSAEWFVPSMACEDLSQGAPRQAAAL